jgi:mannose-6-phosphate isomerase
MNPLIFKPIYKERVWGGQKLATRLGRTIPSNRPIGESWELVDREADQSVVAQGPHQGKSLKQLLESHGAEIMGPKYERHTPFPILVKWLDCKDTLSVQVHPPKDIAPLFNGAPKTENWYIFESEPKAPLYLGLVPNTNLSDFSNAIEQNRLEPLLARTETQAGDSYLIESGTLHAIGGGNLILEIQQNSDTTYRAYDWNRLGLDGNPRELHIDNCTKSLIINELPIRPKRIQGRSSILVDSPHFRITGHTLTPDCDPIILPSHESPRLVHVTQGQVTESLSQQTIQLGDTVLLPYVSEASENQLKATETATVLITDCF